jgi:hypothetical protein
MIDFGSSLKAIVAAREGLLNPVACMGNLSNELNFNVEISWFCPATDFLVCTGTFRLGNSRFC